MKKVRWTFSRLLKAEEMQCSPAEGGRNAMFAYTICSNTSTTYSAIAQSCSIFFAFFCAPNSLIFRNSYFYVTN